jgi:hypothetical protein
MLLYRFLHIEENRKRSKKHLAGKFCTEAVGSIINFPGCFNFEGSPAK